MKAKPLGRKAYGSIPHLPNSRLGPGDHKCHEGQARICLEKVRDKHDRIIVTEKLDGSNTAVANVDGNILALGRAGYLAQTSKYEQHQLFADWVRKNENIFWTILNPGQTLHGEWLAQAHGTKYVIDNPLDAWIVFDLMTDGARNSFDEMRDLCMDTGLKCSRVLNDGGSFGMSAVMPLLETSGHNIATGEEVEGAVWRVERNGEFDFLVKWVRPNKQDGKYLPEVSGEPAVWNWRPKQTP